ncbi:DUF4375 domain-containing protein [Leptospira bourretii]|uniref:DMP19 family protein n=1 Tax=Leptospira bourretii TaxID=2484962 RepID=UPI001090CE2A|nr:DUF4375 domain-containing protein [Leptospira bourretii]TGL23751.1 DUF4375 domain-containing protein [Leptospira bourretii]
MSYSELIEKNYAEAVEGIKEEWLKEPNTKWYEYVIGLPMQLRICYLIVVFHNQIFNGGFNQYFVNGYGQFATETVSALKKIGALEKADLLVDALKIANFEKFSDDTFRKQLLEKKIARLFSTEDLFESLDNRYYIDTSEDLQKLLESYLRSI